MRLYDSRLESAGSRDVPPGTIVGCDASGLTVVAANGAVRVGKARLDGTREKKPAAEIVAALGLTVGSRLT